MPTREVWRMPDRLFGQYLGRVVSLSGHDVAEILEDQSTSGRRFGEIALAWRLCEPQHVWEAWANQLEHRTPSVDLDAVGVDAQATAELPARLARRFSAVAVRRAGSDVVVATDADSLPRAEARLPGLLRGNVHFVLAPAAQIAAALATYYPAPRTDEP